MANRSSVSDDVDNVQHLLRAGSWRNSVWGQCTGLRLTPPTKDMKRKTLPVNSNHVDDEYRNWLFCAYRFWFSWDSSVHSIRWGTVQGRQPHRASIAAASTTREATRASDLGKALRSVRHQMMKRRIRRGYEMRDDDVSLERSQLP